MADKQKTVKVKNQYGDTIEVPVGVDGKNPVSPNNPMPKAVAPEFFEQQEAGGRPIGEPEGSPLPVKPKNDDPGKRSGSSTPDVHSTRETEEKTEAEVRASGDEPAKSDEDKKDEGDKKSSDKKDEKSK